MVAVDPPFDELTTYFDRPIAEAALELGVCGARLKQIIRDNGVGRWPFRKYQALLSKGIVSTLDEFLYGPGGLLAEDGEAASGGGVLAALGNHSRNRTGERRSTPRPRKQRPPPDAATHSDGDGDGLDALAYEHDAKRARADAAAAAAANAKPADPALLRALGAAAGTAAERCAQGGWLVDATRAAAARGGAAVLAPL
uniref:RWP-RK domain-containing protein n=2 Tax=Prasinoderma coloniale TaxID=156133 RepID=A0A7R9TL33_9VIRI|mmetsp:Transcript_2719/g.10880  ORF Transcript_2719/g.10880 Transcript_2719/m.10880 type:complete len:198 (+) Transcript_2719:78-671(+)|eukprot:PRCOL_00007102-RA